MFSSSLKNSESRRQAGEDYDGVVRERAIVWWGKDGEFPGQMEAEVGSGLSVALLGSCPRGLPVRTPAV